MDEREGKSITVNGAGRQGADFSFKTSTSEGNRKWTDGKGRGPGRVTGGIKHNGRGACGRGGGEWRICNDNGGVNGCKRASSDVPELDDHPSISQTSALTNA